MMLNISYKYKFIFIISPFLAPVLFWPLNFDNIFLRSPVLLHKIGFALSHREEAVLTSCHPLHFLFKLNKIFFTLQVEAKG
jgi:hypothetical protein